MYSTDDKNSDSYAEMHQAQETTQYPGLWQSGHGKLPSEALKFVIDNPFMEINTSKLFRLLSYIYDAEVEKYVYEDLILVMEKAKR